MLKSHNFCWKYVALEDAECLCDFQQIDLEGDLEGDCLLYFVVDLKEKSHDCQQLIHGHDGLKKQMSEN